MSAPIIKYIAEYGIKKAIEKFGKEKVKDIPEFKGKPAPMPNQPNFGKKKQKGKEEKPKDKYESAEIIKAKNGGMVRGQGKAIRGTKFKGVF